MNTTTPPASLNRSTWFQTVALMDARRDTAHPGMIKPAPAITGQTFADLRQEAAGLKRPATRTGRSNASITISFDTVRFTATAHFLQRAAKATA